MDIFELTEKRFATRNWRLTKGVENVLNVLSQEEVFLTVAEIQTRLTSYYRAIDLVTIYRILKKLAEINVVHEQDGRWTVCQNLENTEPHYFLACEYCDKIEEICLNFQTSLKKQLLKDKGFALDKIKLSFVGTCQKCQEPG